MPRTSCIRHPARSRFIQVREDILDLFQWHYPAAYVLAVLEFKTNGRLDQIEADLEGGNPQPWFSATMKEINQALLGTYRERTVRETIQQLCDADLLKVRHNGVGKSSEYLLNSGAINAMLEIGQTISIGKIADGKNDVEIADEPSAKTARPNKEEELLKEREEEHSASSLSPEQPKAPGAPAPPAPSTKGFVCPDLDTGELDLEDPIEAFWPNIVRRECRQCKLPNLKAKSSQRLLDNVRAAENQHGRPEFRPAMIAFYRDRSDWMKQNNWPVNALLKDVNGWLRQYRAPPGTDDAGAYPALDYAPVLRKASQDPPIQPASSQRDYRAIWDEAMPGSLSEGFTAKDRALAAGYKAALADPDWESNFGLLLGKMQKIVRTDPAKGWRWLFGEAKGTPNWWRVVKGEFDWLYKGGKPKGALEAILDGEA